MSTEICKLVADAGKCSNSLMRYFYDPALGDCRQFVYGGCHGNANRFVTYADCETTCKQTLQSAAHGVDIQGNRPVTSLVMTGGRFPQILDLSQGLKIGVPSGCLGETSIF